MHPTREHIVDGVAVGPRLHLEREEGERDGQADEELHDGARAGEGDEADDDELAEGLGDLPVEEARLVDAVEEVEPVGEARVAPDANAIARLEEKGEGDERDQHGVDHHHEVGERAQR